MLARDVMTEQVLTISESAGLAEAVRLMVSRHISGLPVVDGAGKLVGMLTEGDLLRRTEVGTGERHVSLVRRFLRGPGPDAGDYVRANSRLVGDLMTTEPISVTGATRLEDIVDLMEKKRIKRVPVVEDGRVVGLISRADILRSVDRRLNGAEPPTAGDDAAILARLQTELSAQAWFMPNSVRVEVHHGVVHLIGAVADVRTRDAMIVAAQNASGKREVEADLLVFDPMSGMAVPVT